MMLRVASLVISSLLVTAAFAQPSRMNPQMVGLRTHCKPDVERLCPKIEPGGGRIKACLMDHKNEVSVGCAKALQGLEKAH